MRSFLYVGGEEKAGANLAAGKWVGSLLLASVSSVR